MVCDGCGATVRGVICKGKKRYCSVCHGRDYPPLLIIAKKWEDDKLYHIAENTTLNIDFQHLLGCGFKLYQHKTFFSREKYKDYKEWLVFRYYGNVICNLTKSYKFNGRTQRCENYCC